MRWIDPAEEESVFDIVVSTKDLAERQRLLSLHCGTDAELRKRIESLLFAYETSEYLENQPSEIANFRNIGISLEGTRVGPFEVMQLIGHGGMGEVYLARSTCATRALVAVKVIKPGLDTRQIIARFSLEQRIVQRLNHPNIAYYVDSGIAECGRAYFAMELIRGEPLTEYCDRNRLTIVERLQLLKHVCAAIEYAHRQGIVHRDLKPKNIMVTQRDGQPIIKVIDFGIAKALEKTGDVASHFTGAIEWLGTPNYISPEQMRCSSDVDARSDVYSLGVILYELITGSLPLQVICTSDVDHSLRLQIANADVDRPSYRIKLLPVDDAEEVCTNRTTEHRQLYSQVLGDLDWIALKAIANDKNDRYSSAEKLAADLSAHLENRPIDARGPSVPSRTLKFANRNRTSLVAMTVLAVVLCSIIVVGGLRLSIRRGDEQRKLIQANLEHKNFVQNIQMASKLLRSGDSNAAEKILDQYSTESGNSYADHFAVGYLRGLIPRSELTFVGHQNGILDMDISNEGDWMASGDRGGDILIWNRQNGREIHRLHPSDKEVTRVRFSPTGNLLATAGQDRLVRLWQTGDWKPFGELLNHEVTINGIAWSPDGKQIASGDRDGVVCIWNVETQKCLLTLPKHADAIRCMEWSPDGAHLAISEGDASVKVWETKGWNQVASIPTYGRGALALAFSHNGRILAFGGYFSELITFDLKDLAVIQRIRTQNQIWSLKFGKNQEIIAGEGLGLVQIFPYSAELKNWGRSRVIDISHLNNGARSICLDFLRNIVFVAFEENREIRAFPLPTLSGYQQERSSSICIGAIPAVGLKFYVSKDGEATVESKNSVVRHLPIELDQGSTIAYSAARNLVALTCKEGEARVFDMDSWDHIATLNCKTRIFSMSFSRDGKSLATSGAKGFNRVWNLDTMTYWDAAQSLGNSNGLAVFSPARDAMVVARKETQDLICLNSISGTELRRVDLSRGLHRLCYHPSGEYLVVGEQGWFSVWKEDLSVNLWNAPLSQNGTPGMVEALSFSPDQKTLAVLMREGTLELWDMQSKTRLLDIQTPAHLSDPSLFTPWMTFDDSAKLLIGGPNGTAILASPRNSN